MILYHYKGQPWRYLKEHNNKVYEYIKETGKWFELPTCFQIQGNKIINSADPAERQHSFRGWFNHAEVVPACQTKFILDNV